MNYYPTFGFEGASALKKTKGIALSVSEEEIVNAVRALKSAGVGSELGGAAGFAGYLRLSKIRKRLLEGKKVVVVVSGNN